VTHSVANYTADGNRLVFEELAPLFLELAQLLAARRSAPDEARFLHAAPKSLQPAFRRYLAAAHESDDKTRAQLMLLANLEAVHHEQERLDSRIRGALDAAVEGALKWLAGLRWLGPVRELIDELVERVETDQLLTLRTHSEALPLSRDLTRPDGRPLYLPPLDAITLRELHALLRRWGAADDSGEGAGAENWASLPDRMRYLCALFRSCQRDESLFAAPFDEEQLEALRKVLSGEHR
jgi:hypothetical protein